MTGKITQLIGAVFLCCAVVGAPAIADSKRDPVIQVSGRGKVQAVPDLAVLQTGVVTEGKTAKAALDANSETMTNVVDGLKAMGLAAKDLRTANFSINPKYNRSSKSSGSQIVGFEVRNSVSVVIRDVSTVGDVLDRVASLGANQFGGLQFIVEDADAKLDAARAAAIADARRKAELYVKSAGAKLGRVLSIQESGSGPQRQTGIAGTMSMSRAAPIEAGETTLSVSVRVVWMLEDDD